VNFTGKHLNPYGKDYPKLEFPENVNKHLLREEDDYSGADDDEVAEKMT
jgi:hypothetical protein